MKKIVYLTNSLLLLLIGTSFAQFNLDWNATYVHTNSFNYSNESRKMAKDAAGNLYILADATSNIDPNGVSGTITYHYTIVLQYSNAGVLIKTRVIDVTDHMTTGFDNRGAFGIEIDSSGFLYIGYNSFKASSGFDINITKYSLPDVTLLWTYKFVPSSTDNGVDLKIGSGGMAYAVVQSLAGTNTQYHLIKCDTVGISLTPFYSFDVNMDYLSSLVVKSGTNDAYVTGYRFINNVKNALTAGVKANGTLQWKKTYNGGTIIRDDSGKQIILGTDNNLYVCGTSDRGVPNNNDIMVLSYFTGNGKFNWVNYIDYNFGNDNGVLVKQVDANDIYVGSVSGNTALISRLKMIFGIVTGRGTYSPIPDNPHTSVNGISLSQLCVSSTKNIYITGSALATDLNNQSFSAFYLAKLVPVNSRSNTNNAIRLAFYRQADGDLANSFKASDLILDESSQSIFLTRDKIQSFSTHSKETVELISYNIPAPYRLSNSEIYNASEITIQPNPASDRIEVSSLQPMQYLEILDNTGRLVKSYEANNGTIETLDISEIQDGIYMLIIRSASGEMETRKFIKN